MLCPYVMNSFQENINVLKVGDVGITPMDKFSDTTTDISIKNHHTWGCPAHVLDTRLQGDISGLPKW